MKTKLFILSLLFAACQKEETEPTIKTWNLTFQTVGVSIKNLPVTSVLTLYDNEAIGNTLYFEEGDFNVTISVLYSGEVVQMSGNISGSSFIVLNGAINICGGNQNQSFTYNLIKP